MMNASIRCNLLVLLLFGFARVASGQEKRDARQVDFFEKKIRPVLVEHCYKCHSTETKKTRGGLALDTRAGIREGGDTGPAIVPGKPDQSILLKAIRHDGTVKMPNAEKKLPDNIIADFETWIKLGAADPRDGKSVAKKGIDFDEARRHWAYQPVQAPKAPSVKNGQWPIVDLDRFILAAIEAKALQPASDVARHAWLRRVSFDLVGLPPSPEEVDAFMNDKSAEAHARVVDRLLASPRFGEHWARHWLDGVRFNSGFLTLEHYRDWVVRAFNADLPYDRFLVMQLAGDLLPPAKDVNEQADRVFATQMLMLNQKEMDPVEGAIEVVGQQVLGVSINCAKCHDHKFDAYTQRDYYALAGIFTSTSIAGAKKNNLKGEGVPVPGKGLAVTAVTEGKIGDTNLLVRGEKKTPGPLVPRQFPVVLAGDKQTALGKLTKQSGRLELARWIADPSHPLTARVFVNRAWQQLFGQGIVRTPNDFGLNGDAPVNRELLDHLAGRFGGDMNWSLKKLLREITLSRTYRQSAVNEAAVKADPENRLYAHAQVRRLTYEQTIDALYASANILSFEIPTRGKPNTPFPRFGGGKNAKELTTAGHRALYHDDPPTRKLFDGADPELLTERRDESVTAPQMLFFLNNSQVLAIAGQVSSRAGKLASSNDPAAKVAAAYTLLFARGPNDQERDRAVQFLKSNTFERYCQVLLASSEFSYLQ